MQKSFALYSLAVVNFTHIVDSMLIMPLGDIFIKEFQLDAQEYSYLVSAYAVGAVISSLAAFLYLDRFNRKTALLFLYGGFILGTVMCGLSNGYWTLLVTRLVTGAFGGIIGALAFAIAADLYPFKERGSAIGVLMAAFSAASALGVPFSLYLAALYSWRLPFIGLGIMGLVILGFLFIKFPSIDIHKEDLKENLTIRSTISLLIRDSNQLKALLLGMILVLGHFIIIPFISPYMIRNVGFSQLDISLIFLLGGVAMIFSAPIVGRLTDHFGVMKVFTIFIFLSFIPTIGITHMGPSPLWYGLIFTTLFFIFGSSRMIPANTIITASTGAANRGSFMSMKSALQQLAIAVASVLSGMIVYINDEGLYERYSYVAYLSIAFCIWAIFLCSKLRVAAGN